MLCEVNIDVFEKKFLELVKSKNVSKICREIGISPSPVYQLLYLRRNCISTTTALKIINYFKIPVRSFITKIINPGIPAPPPNLPGYKENIFLFHNKRFRFLLRKTKIPMLKLAKYSGVTLSTLYGLKNGTVTQLHFDKIKQIAYTLEVEPRALVWNPDKPTKLN